MSALTPQADVKLAPSRHGSGNVSAQIFSSQAPPQRTAGPGFGTIPGILACSRAVFGIGGFEPPQPSPPYICFRLVRFEQGGELALDLDFDRQAPWGWEDGDLDDQRANGGDPLNSCLGVALVERLLNRLDLAAVLLGGLGVEPDRRLAQG
jgi:hypothetical protein